MQQSTNERASRIAEAVLRIAVYIKKGYLARRIEVLALGLAEYIFREDHERALRALNGLEGLIAIGASILEIEPMNSALILDSLKQIRSDIEKEKAPEGFSQSELKKILKEGPRAKKKKSFKKGDTSVKEGEIENQALYSGNEYGNDSFNEQDQAANPQEMRQTKMIETIRQLPDRRAQLKDLIPAFQGVSERTLRYDLQKLCSSGMLIRVGNGGPSTYYVMK